MYHALTVYCLCFVCFPVIYICAHYFVVVNPVCGVVHVKQSIVGDVDEPLIREGGSDISDRCLGGDRDRYAGDP